MMDHGGMMGGGMMLWMDLIGALIVIVLVLGIVALIKYLRSGPR